MLHDLEQITKPDQISLYLLYEHLLSTQQHFEVRINILVLQVKKLNLARVAQLAKIWFTCFPKQCYLLWCYPYEIMPYKVVRKLKEIKCVNAWYVVDKWDFLHDHPSPLGLKILHHLLSCPLESQEWEWGAVVVTKGALGQEFGGPPIVPVSTMQMNFQALSSPIDIPNLPTSPLPI